jgi:hypothetical protein
MFAIVLFSTSKSKLFKRELAARCGIGERPQTAGQGDTHKLRRYQIAMCYSVHSLTDFMRAHRMLQTREFANPNFPPVTKPNFPPVTRIEIDWLCQFSRKSFDRIFGIQSLLGTNVQCHVKWYLSIYIRYSLHYYQGSKNQTSWGILSNGRALP